jgi:hypothetical protein
MNRYNTGLIHVARDICAHNRMLVMTISGSSDGQGGTEMSARRGEGPIADRTITFAPSRYLTKDRGHSSRKLALES